MKPQISALTLFLLVSCATTPRSNPKAEIESILSQRDGLKRTFLQPEWGPPGYSEYVPAVKSLDVGRCPPDFKHAWFDYVVALAQLHEHDRDADLEGLAKVLGAAVAIHTG